MVQTSKYASLLTLTINGVSRSFLQSASKRTKIGTDIKILKKHSLNSVLRVGFALPAHWRGRVQKAVFPYWISSITIQCLDHLGQEIQCQPQLKQIHSHTQMHALSVIIRRHVIIERIPLICMWMTGVRGLCSCSPTCSWEGGQGEWVRCRTCELCRPRPRWMLQHSSQINTPLLTEAQRGSTTHMQCL